MLSFFSVFENKDERTIDLFRITVIAINDIKHPLIPSFLPHFS